MWKHDSSDQTLLTPIGCPSKEDSGCSRAVKALPLELWGWGAGSNTDFPISGQVASLPCAPLPPSET